MLTEGATLIAYCPVTMRGSPSVTAIATLVLLGIPAILYTPSLVVPIPVMEMTSLIEEEIPEVGTPID